MKAKKTQKRLIKQETLSLNDRQVRIELNEAKWPAIWAPAHDKTIRGPRRTERPFTNPDGTSGVQSVTVHYLAEVGTLTTEELRTQLALMLLWENSGRDREKPAPFSICEIEKVLGIRKSGGSSAAKIRKSLMRLCDVPITWEKSFYQKSTNEILTLHQSQPILSYLIFAEKKEKGKKNTRGAFKFNWHIVDNLLANYSKPVYIADSLAINSEIAFLLFIHLDLVMADKPTYERNSADLFRDLGLSEHKKYQYPFGRKQALQPALKQLLGKRLSTGAIKSIQLASNAKRNDWKLVVRKGPYQEINIKAMQITADEHEESLTDEQQALTAQLHNEFSVVIATATRLATEHFESTRLQLAAWPYRDHSQIQDKAGWIIRATENSYELPQAYLDAIKEQQQREKLTRAKAKIAACSLCDDNGFRMIVHEGQKCAKRCSHDPSVEEQFQSA